MDGNKSGQHPAAKEVQKNTVLCCETDMKIRHHEHPFSLADMIEFVYLKFPQTSVFQSVFISLV